MATTVSPDSLDEIEYNGRDLIKKDASMNDDASIASVMLRCFNE